MKVFDRATGNILESDIPIVIESWKTNPERFTAELDGEEAKPADNKRKSTKSTGEGAENVY